MTEHLRTAAKEVTNVERPIDLKIIQKETFGEKMFCGKFPFRAIGASDGSS